MKIKTVITDVQSSGSEMIRGKKLTELIETYSFSHTIFFLLFQKEPTESEQQMFDALLTAVIDHGPGTTSALVSRISASAKNPIHASLAAGILGFGGRHGMALTPAMEFFYAHKDTDDLLKLLQTMKEQKRYVPGFGHKLLTDEDPRATALFHKAKELDIYGEYCTFAHVVYTELNAMSSKKLPINIDGAVAAILCDMGIDAKIGNGIFLIGRVPGLIAHIVEEIDQDNGILRLGSDEVDYVA